jgi:hypothetical protein
MRVTRTSVHKSALFVTLGILLGWFSVSPIPAHGQAGDNAICNSSSPPTGISCSAAFIDASVGTSGDLCARIYSIISSASYPTTGEVIDARGINPGGPNTCANTPWWNGTTNLTKPSYILLPSGNITISHTWIMPDRARIWGEGRGSPSGSGTILIAKTSFPDSDMIDMGAGTTPTGYSTVPCLSGTSPAYCFGVSIENLMLDGNGQAINGIVNTSSQDLSYVNNVNLYTITGTGLEISGAQAQNSGPFTNVTFSPGPNAVAGTVCVQISQVGDTRGVHGLTCTADGTPSAGILLDSNNNSLEDIHFEGFVDGIRVGSNHNANSNILFNITGGNGSGGMTNVIHVYNTNTVNDLTIMAVGQGATGINTVKDDITSTTLADATVGIYALGQALGGGVTRFTTSPNSVTWGAGSGTPTGSCKSGSIFSNTGGTSSTTLYICVSGGWVAH